MRLPGKRRSKKELTRRELVALRRESAQHADEQSSGVPASAYRRSRTLVSATRSTEDISQSERQQAHDARTKKRKLLTWVGGIAGGVVLVLFLLSQLTLDVRVVGSPDRLSESDAASYVEILNEYYATRPLERLRFMTNKATLQSFFLERAAEVRSVSVAGDGGLTKSKLQVVFRQPTIQWLSGGKPYFVDDSGVTFEKSYFPAPAVTVDDQSGVPAELGQEIINRRFLSFLGTAVSLFDKQQLKVTGIVLPPDTVRQAHFAVDGRPYYIKMTVDRGAEAQVQEAAHAVRFMQEQGRSPEYIDVRVDQRVFYRG